MEKIGHIHIWHYVPFTDIPIPFGGVNIHTIYNTVLVMIVLWILLFFAIRKTSWIPGRTQMALESVLNGFQSLIDSTMFFEPPHVRRSFLPFLAGLFVYITVSNAILIVPLPHVEKPTSDLNDTLALGISAVAFAMFSGFRAKGLADFCKEMCGPLFYSEGRVSDVLMDRASAFFFLPLHLMEEGSRILSISCRLFGNIMGGAIVILVVSTLSYYIFLPLILYAFFLVFEAVLQGFVFSMLTLTYIAGELQEE